MNKKAQFERFGNVKHSLIDLTALRTGRKWDTTKTTKVYFYVSRLRRKMRRISFLWILLLFRNKRSGITTILYTKIWLIHFRVSLFLAQKNSIILATLTERNSNIPKGQTEFVRR